VGCSTKIYQPATSTEAAIKQVEAWLESPSLQLIGEHPTYWTKLRALIETSHVVGPKVHDARIAAICQLHAVEKLWSADRDFSRFSDLVVESPLRSA
ncbi:MAG: VapC toxin family PIN domain ribonuclease, partial [Acidobacteriota bacterium]